MRNGLRTWWFCKVYSDKTLGAFLGRAGSAAEAFFRARIAGNFERDYSRRRENPEVLAMGYTVTEIQPTPNPNAAKFVLDREISDRPISFLHPAEGGHHALASQLFAVKGVKSLLLLGDFVTVNKDAATKWEHVVDKVKEILQNAP